MRTPSSTLPRWTIYILGVALTLGILWVHESIASSMGNRPLMILFMFPIIVSSYLGGRGPGFVSTALAVFGLNYLALAPLKNFTIASDLDLFQLSLLCINGILVSLLGEGFRQALIRLNSKDPSTQNLVLVEHSSQSPFLFLRLFLPVFIAIGLAGYFYADSEIRLKLQELRASDQEAVSLATNSLHTTLDDMTGDILFLAKLPRLLVALNAPNSVNFNNLAETWSVYMEAQGTCAQIRWIDETGMEKVRVNFENGHAQWVPKAQLQDKSKRLFFIQTSTLQA